MGGIGDSLEFLPPLTNIASTLVVQRGTPSVAVDGLLKKSMTAAGIKDQLAAKVFENLREARS
jgi:hypothetical protein